ncbi:hypothetical protein [uncultured Arthrobacter sp.]|uniref:hypothetical protein n=1 Tax=uncultured Arthrobacter sp. TaxID=114050 RepID=UPI00260F222B|nr:hypothetical protein [uncultured Arthrobacter sp.]
MYVSTAPGFELRFAWSFDRAPLSDQVPLGTAGTIEPGRTPSSSMLPAGEWLSRSQSH